MYMHLITSNPHLALGARLSGIDVNEVNGGLSSSQAAFHKAVENKEIAVLCISEELEEDLKDTVGDYEKSHSVPAIVHLPLPPEWRNYD